MLKTHENFLKTSLAHETSALSFENFYKDFNESKILKGLGTHQCLDFLNLSLSMPVNFTPQSHISKDYTNQLKQILAMKKDIVAFTESDVS